MDLLGNLTIEHFNLYTEESLRLYLAIRKKTVDGTFQELAARAFVASEEKVPVDVEMEERHRISLVQYKGKLVDGASVPDPFELDAKTWTSESKGGILKWPSIYYIPPGGA